MDDIQAIAGGTSDYSETDNSAPPQTNNQMQEDTLDNIKQTETLDNIKQTEAAAPSSSKPCDKSEAQVFNINSSSLCNLLVYSSGESASEDEAERSDDSDSYECESHGEETSEKPIKVAAGKKMKKPQTLMETLKSMGELTIDDLPPVPEIAAVTVREDECDEIGKISSIIDKLVMVESIPNKPAYDIDTLLFLDNGKQPLGYIFDVIGAVTCPMYAVRFNTVQEIAALNITKGLPVFSAPKSEHTQYVFVQQLLRAKGTDASWSQDLEVPQEHQDYSDDESEVCKSKPDNRKRNSIERYQTFEKDMNVKNLIDTRLHKIRDNFEPMQKKHTPNNNFKRGYCFQPNYRPNFGFSQPANTSSASCAFPPPFGLPPFMPSNMPMPYGPQNIPAIPPFVPTMPPPPHNFIPRLPPPLPSMPPFPPIPQNVPYTQEMVNAMFQSVPMSANTSQAKTRMMYPPPDMSLPRPPSQNPNFVPNMPFYDPRIRMWHSFPNTPPNTRQLFLKPMRNQFPKRQ